MTRKEAEVLRLHTEKLAEQGERLAKVEATLSNHVLSDLEKLRAKLDGLDGRLWALLGAVLITMLGVAANLVLKLVATQ